MLQQFCDLAGTLRGQPLQNVLDALVGVVPAELGRLDQASVAAARLPAASIAANNQFLRPVA